MHKNGNVKVRMLWLRMVLNNILWHLKATHLSFTSSRFIVWAFTSCVLELDPNPGCHTQNHMVHLFLWPRTWWDSAYQNRPPATHSHSVEKMENVASMPSLNRGSSVHIPWGQGAGQSHSQQGDIKLTGAFSLDIYFPGESSKLVKVPTLCDLAGTLWTNRNAPSLFQKSSKCLLAFFQIWGGFFF